MRFSFTLALSICLFSILVGSITLSALLPVYAQEEFRQREFVEQGKPRLVDPHLKVVTTPFLQLLKPAIAQDVDSMIKDAMTQLNETRMALQEQNDTAAMTHLNQIEMT